MSHLLLNDFQRRHNRRDYNQCRQQDAYFRGAEVPTSYDLLSLATPATLKWPSEEEISLRVFSYMDIHALFGKRVVSKAWMTLCKKTIDFRCKNQKNFESNAELRAAVRKYCGHSFQGVEEAAVTYGYPINNWKVHKVSDFAHVFEDCNEFNEYIGSWDVSSAKTLHGMFQNACCFNQPLEAWDTSQVEDMSYVFCEATKFNKSLANWSTSMVRTMKGMFSSAHCVRTLQCQQSK
jgi:hypothetical protein